jgi:polysaccharide export outer membrane protein
MVKVREPVTAVGYAVVQLGPDVVTALDSADRPPAFSFSKRSRAPDVRVGVGDIMALTIYEARPGGLFFSPDAVSRGGNSIELPRQQVDQSGSIQIPYAGSVKAAGRTVDQIQTEVRMRLEKRAIEPQVMVTMVERRSEAVSVLGDVQTPARFSLDPGGIRILEAIARSGGTKYPSYESVVTLQRHGRTEKVLLGTIADRPDENIQLHPGDVIYVTREPRYFMALGATGQTTTLGPLDRRFPFEGSRMSLAEALAKAGGLQDDRAYARAIFLYRVEARATLERLGIDVRWAQGPYVPTVYLVDLSEPSGWFLTNGFVMRNQDIIYVSNAPSVDFLKFVTVARAVMQTVSDARTAVERR